MNNDFHIFTVIYSSLYGFITNQHNDQCSADMLAQLVEHCTGIAEVMQFKNLMIIKDKLPTNTAAQGLSPTRQASEARFSRRQKAIFKHPSRWFRPHGLCPLSLSLVTLTLALCRSVSNLWAWSPVTWLYSNRKPPISLWALYGCLWEISRIMDLWFMKQQT